MSEIFFSPENINEENHVQWDSLDIQKIDEKLLKYYYAKNKENLKLVKNEGGENSDYTKCYQDKNGRIVRTENKHIYISEEDSESSNDLSEKEYDYNEKGDVETIRYFTSNNTERDQVLYSKSSVGEIKFNYDQGKITKAFVMDVSQVEADEGTIKNTLEGKEISFYFEYDGNEIIRIAKEENKFGELKKDKNVFYERSKDKETIFYKMSAAEIIEWELTRSNDLK